MFKSLSKGFVKLEFSFIKEMFYESFYVFIGVILAPLYTSANIFILRFFTNPLIVGYYAVAEKILNAVGMLASIINRTFYPYLSQLYVTSIELYKINIKRILLIVGSVFFMLASIQFFAAPLIIKLLMGKNHGDVSYAVTILKIMSIALPFSPFVSFFFQLLIIQGQKKESALNIGVTGFVNIITACIFTYFWSAKGLAVNLCVMMIMLCFLNSSSFFN